MGENVTIPIEEYKELKRYEEIVQSLEWMVHEPKFKEEFVERVKAAEARVNAGEAKEFSSVEELKKHLEE